MTHFGRILWGVPPLLWCLSAPVADAGVATDRLQDFFKEVHSLQGDFTQTVYDQQMNVKDSAQGTFALQRPGKFHWNYEKPYRQLIVANGEKVWIYDSELEQVTVKKLDETVGSTPAQLLSSSESLERNFTLDEIGVNQGLEWVELTPRDKDTGFERVKLGFDRRDLRVMELKDSFGQTTRLEFSHLRRNPRLAASLFEFTPPRGVDVVGDTN
jgi:outer membrane lipoprotein carrier protein